MLIPLNEGWQFARGEPTGFRPVVLPHDWLIDDVTRLYESGVGWYRRGLDASFLEPGQRVSLRFDGVYMDSALFVNGEPAGAWKYGYTAFEHDITDHVRRDAGNTLLLKVDYRAPSARWYTGAGIYRDVTLCIRNAAHFVPGGIYITTARSPRGWAWAVDAEVSAEGRPYDVRHTLLDAGGEIETWDVEHPRLYTMRSELLVDGAVQDVEDTRFGFRTIDLTPDRGLYLNGRRLKLNGVCLHSDLGPLGAAVHRDWIRRQLTVLRKMGVNALRTAHNPPAAVFMDLADEMGFLVLSELLDVWRRPKTTHDYARFFDEWIERDVASWIRRDRNRPSVILWSVGNEIPDTHVDPVDGERTLRRLTALVREHDPAGHARPTFCSNYLPWEDTQRCADLVKIVGYNYAEALYPEHHAAHPDWVIYGGETCSTVQSRGVYHFPLSRSILADDDLQCSALGNSSTSWGARSVESCIRADRTIPYSLGQFIWAGQDYLGEPTPYHTKSSYLGHIDTAGFEKDTYYLFQAAWTDYRRAPMVHLFPYWDFSPGQMIDVRVCSNAPAVELFQDGASLGRVALGEAIVADWRIPYRPGALRAVALDQRGVVVAETWRRSFGEVTSLSIREERVGELIFATISAVDTSGGPVENANRRVHVHADGGTLLALDNGDATDYEQYRSGTRRLFNGKLLAVLRPEPDTPHRIIATLDEVDIPIRKIELHAEGLTVRARPLPPEATDRELVWRLTDTGGIDSPLGSLEVSDDGRQATVIPRGDGEVQVRCAARNGRDHVTLISQITLTITGVGVAHLDPYTFVSGGLCNRSNVDLTNGNERGIATHRGRESHVGFADLDFGDYGSDEITLALFPLEREPFVFEIWEGMPREGASALTAVAWDKGSVWNTYQEITCTLPRRLRGVTTVCLVFRRKVHVKGFRFTRHVKAYRRLNAAECDAIYGDAFTFAGDTVEGIGNNVVLVFRSMDFGSAGATRLALCWRSNRTANSVQILFADGEKDLRASVDIPRSDTYTTAILALGACVRGLRTVSLTFPPGSSLDLAWVQFQV